jgi:hypothetical protein
MLRALSLISLAALTSAFCGCGGSSAIPVQGTVTLDGKPVADAVVTFAPQGEGEPAAGATNASGKFILQRREAGDGVPPGSYAVTVVGVRTTGLQATSDGLSDITAAGQIKEEWFVPQKYSIRESSGLQAEVKPGMPPVELKLTSK